MNNCPKCGNPVQVGTSTCPICGTSLMPSQTIPSVEPVKVTPVAASQNQTAPVSPQVNEIKKEVVNNTPQVPQTQPNVEVRKPIPTPPVAPSAPIAPQEQVQATSPSVSEIKPQVNVAVAPVVPNTPQTITPVTPQAPITPQVQVTPVQSVTPTPQVPQAQAPVQPNIVSQATQSVEPVAPTPPVTPVTPVAPVTPAVNQDFSTPVIPNIEEVPVDNAMPNMASMSLPTSGVELPTVNAPTTFQDITNTKQKKKLNLKINKNTLFMLGVALLVLIIIIVLTKLPSKQAPVVETPKLVTKEVDANGYRFNKVDGWFVSEDGKDTIILNSKETVSIYLYNMNYSFSTVSNDNIETFLNNNGDYSDISIEELQVGTKNAKVVSANTVLDSNKLPVEYYYIEGGSALTIGASVVYNSEEDYNNFKDQVKDMLSNMSYANDSNKVLNKMSKYSSLFGTGQRIYNTYGTALDITIME